MANNRARVYGEQWPASADTRMYYTNPAGIMLPVAGSFGNGKVPTGQTDGSVMWATPSGGGGGGGPIVLQTVTASASASLDASSWANASLYNRYTLELHEIVLSGSDNLWLRLGAGSIDASGVYAYGLWSFHAGGGGQAGVASGANHIGLAYDSSGDGLSTGSGWGLSAVLDLMHAGSTSSYKQVGGWTRSKDSLGPTRNSVMLGGTYESLSAIDRIRILPSGSNTITTGKLVVRGWPIT